MQVYGEGAVTDQTCQKWFAKCCAGDFSLDDAPRSGRPVEVEVSGSTILTRALIGHCSWGRECVGTSHQFFCALVTRVVSFTTVLTSSIDHLPGT